MGAVLIGCSPLLRWGDVSQSSKHTGSDSLPSLIVIGDFPRVPGVCALAGPFQPQQPKEALRGGGPMLGGQWSRRAELMGRL